MGRRVEVPVVVGRVVQNVHVVVGSGAPLDQWQPGSGERLEQSSILIDPPKNNRADRKNDTRRVITSSGEHMMNQPPMEPAIAIDERMDVNESERDGSGSRNRFRPTSD